MVSEESIKMYINLDDKIDQHSRRVLNILEVTGVLEGLFEIFKLDLRIILGFYASISFKRDIMNW